MYHYFHSDLVEACKWIKPDLNKYDAIFFTTDCMNHPYIITLLMFNYNPEQWFNDKHIIYPTEEWDLHVRYGKCYFMYEGLWEDSLKDLMQNGKKDRVLFVVRPDAGEYKKFNNVIHKIYRCDGMEILWICEEYI